jgi:hypothetical protein
MATRADSSNVEELPFGDHLNDAQLLHKAARLAERGEIDSTIILGYDPEGKLIMLSANGVTQAMANWTLDCAKQLCIAKLVRSAQLTLDEEEDYGDD